MVPAGRWRTGWPACWRRMASSSARCSGVRLGLIVGFIASLLRLWDIVGGDRADDEWVGQIQHFEHNGDEPARTGAAKRNGAARGVAHLECGVLIQECGLNLLRAQAMFRDMCRIASFVIQLVPIDQGVPQVHTRSPTAFLLCVLTQR